ncbi:MAG: twin-arginine translocation signal domain-containing protein [Tannerella sp.]|nr:twin-arginine translocation signal domain-containing protein [Tannerella sp.]
MKEKNFTRRNFITASGLVGGGLILSGGESMAKHLFSNKSEKGEMRNASASKFKMAIIWCGNRSKALISALNSVVSGVVTGEADEPLPGAACMDKENIRWRGMRHRRQIHYISSSNMTKKDGLLRHKRQNA